MVCHTDDMTPEETSEHNACKIKGCKDGIVGNIHCPTTTAMIDSIIDRDKDLDPFRGLPA